MRMVKTMKIDKKNIIVLSVLAFMVVVFAAVTTTLVINGNLAIRTNNEDFNNNVIFTKAETENGEVSISDDGKTITYNSNTLKNLGQIENLDFTVTNKSRQYDAEASIECIFSDDNNIMNKYLDIEINPTHFDLEATESKDGRLSLELIRSYIGDQATVELKCTINVEAIERDSLSDPYTEPEKENFLMARVNGDKIWKHTANIKSITFENKMSADKEATITYDMSLNQDKSIMAYLVPNAEDSTKYDVYIEADGKIMAPENSSNYFSGFGKMETIENIDYLDTSNVTDMSFMFAGSSGLKSLDLSSFNTSKVTNMMQMFVSCANLTTLNLKGFDTKNITTMSQMFAYCGNLTNLDLSSFDTSNVTDMSLMFYNCYKLPSIDISSFDTSNVTNMSLMFYNCNSLVNLNLSNFNTSKVANMSNMFYNMQNLTNLDISSFDTSGATNISRMFMNCSALTNLDLSKFNTNKVTDISSIFYGCTSLIDLDISGFDITNVQSGSDAFRGINASVVIKINNATVKGWAVGTSGNKLTDANFTIIP